MGEGTDDGSDLPDEVASVLQLIDDMEVVARTAERGVVDEHAGIAVVRVSHVELLLGDAALERVEVFALGGGKLVQADECLAGEIFQEVLVVVVGGRVVGEVVVQARRQQMFQEGGLVDAALAHEQEHRLVDVLLGDPSRHHGHEPLLEGILEEFVRMVVLWRLQYRYGVRQFVDVVRVLPLLPVGECLEVFYERIEVLAEVAVEERVELSLAGSQTAHVHDGVEGILLPFPYRCPFVEELVVGVVGSYLVLVGHDVEPNLASAFDPLLDGVHAGIPAVSLARGVEMPGAEGVQLVIHPVHDVADALVLRAHLGAHPGEKGVLVSPVAMAEVGEAQGVLVVGAWYELAVPALRLAFHRGDDVVEGG